MKMDRNETIPVYSGRPQKEEDEKKRCVYDALDALSIPYLRAEHNAAHTIEDCAEIENALGAPVCKNLLLCNRQKTAFYLLIMPGDKPFKTKDVTAKIQSARLSFAGPEMSKANRPPGLRLSNTPAKQRFTFSKLVK